MAFFGLIREKKNLIQHFLEKSDWPTYFTKLFWIQKWKKPFYKCCSKMILKVLGLFLASYGRKRIWYNTFKRSLFDLLFSLNYFEYRNEKKPFYKCCSKMILKSVRAFFGLIREKKNVIQHFLEKSDWPTFFTYLFWIQKWKKALL